MHILCCAGEEFRSLRAELPGSRKTRDEEVATLRQENTQLREQLKAAQEQENLELRGRVRVLTRRLEQVGGYVDITVTSSQESRKGKLKPIDP